MEPSRRRRCCHWRVVTFPLGEMCEQRVRSRLVGTSTVSTLCVYINSLITYYHLPLQASCEHLKQ